MQTSGEPRREFSVAATIIKLPVRVSRIKKKASFSFSLSLSLSFTERKEEETARGNKDARHKKIFYDLRFFSSIEK